MDHINANAAPPSAQAAAEMKQQIMNQAQLDHFLLLHFFYLSGRYKNTER
ncbi:hypothetical protein QNH39_25145 [Neobacillus novalis]|uniref:Uncharacterized protein n=1 Tax=Neobacillus novalis TaxID=220687 RepID=A0AA95MME1_9BACI|nr:hypothetical protein [Neobacillus novalis]WHY85847.1 hypothetical protein QNH39_25145 [Neobacillus novalis]